MSRDVHARVVEVRRVAGGRGSGFAVTADLVLTAKHLVAGAAEVRVVAGDDEVTGAVVWKHPTLDAALVRVPGLRWDGPRPGWGTVSGVGAVPCTAIGYPKAQLGDEGTPVEEQIAGFIMPGTGRRAGRYAVNVISALPYDLRPPRSPWSGMSGAALLTDDGQAVLGVITDDPVSFEPSRLEAVPVADLLTNPAFAELVGGGPGALVAVPLTPVADGAAGSKAFRQERAAQLARLHGDFQQLCDRGDLKPLVACATNLGRHRLLRALSGADAVALAEIGAALELSCGQPDPDLAAIVRLARAQEHLEQHNVNTPHNLPAVWALLGDPVRAEALASAIVSPERRDRGLAALAAVMDPHPTDDAVASDTNPLAILVEALHVVGDLHHAEALAHETFMPAPGYEGHDVGVYVALQADLRAIGEDRLADRLAASRPGTDITPFQVLCELARVVAASGDRRRAAAIAGLAEHAACDVGPLVEELAFANLARVVAVTGDIERAWSIGVKAGRWRVQTLANLVEIAAEQGPDELVDDFLERLEQDISFRADDGGQAEDLTRVALTAHRTGRSREAERLAEEAERVARTPPAGYQDAAIELLRMAEALAELGDIDRVRRAVDHADELIADVKDSRTRDRLRLALAVPLVRIGDTDRAATAAALPAGESRRPSIELWHLTEAYMATGQIERAEELIRRHWDTGKLRIPWVTALAGAGQTVRAEHLACSLRRQQDRAATLAALAELAAADGTECADRLAEAAEAAIAEDDGWSATAAACLVAAFASRGMRDRAVDLALSTVGRTGTKANVDYEAARRTTAVAEALAAAGEVDGAAEVIRRLHGLDRAAALAATLRAACRGQGADVVEGLADKAERECQDLLLKWDVDWYKDALPPFRIPDWEKAVGDLAAALAAAGRTDRALDIAGSIKHSLRPGVELAAVAAAVAEAGEIDKAEAAARSISTDMRWHALANIANTVATRAARLPAPQSRALLARALRLEWTRSLSALAVVDPGALRATADALLYSAARSSP